MMKKLISLVAILMVIGFYACLEKLPKKKAPAPTETADVDLDRMGVVGDEIKHGIYDPSIEYGDDGVGYMAYSGLEMPKIHTHLAKTTDHGKTWTYVKRINLSTESTINDGGKTKNGVWRNEVASLVHDPQDKGSEWKLFWHKYFVSPPYKQKDRNFAFGWIAHRYASNPEGKWSEEIPLFGAGQFPRKPHKAKSNLSGLHADLKKYIYYSEPGAYRRDGVLYMSLEGSASRTGMGQWKTRRIFLIASHDHGKTWKYVGPLTGQKDANLLGYTAFFGSSLFEEGGRQFLMVVPSGSTRKAYKMQDGLCVFEFEDISKAKLKRDTSGNLIVHRRFEMHSGAGDYHEKNTYGGIVTGHVDPKALPRAFQILETKEGVVTKPGREKKEME
jgi:hypothetical protein